MSAVPHPVVPYGKRSFGSRSAVLTAASTERVCDGRGRRGKKEKKTSLVCGGRVGVCAAAARLQLTAAPAARAIRRPLPSPLPSLPPPVSAVPSLTRPVPQPLLAPLSLRTVEVFGLCPARLTITFLSLADVRPVPRPVVPYGKRSFGSRSAVLTAKHPPTHMHKVKGRGIS